MGALIRIGEAMRLKTGKQWNHMFLVSDEVDVDGTPLVIQATLKGVTDTERLDSVAPGGTYTLVPTPEGVDPTQTLAFAKAQVGIEYGFWTIIAISLDIVTWQWFPSFRGARKQSWICSALVCEALRFGGWLHPWVSIYTVTPAQGWDALQ